MRILQVANVPTRIGGTGACAYDVTRALPGDEHRIIFTRSTKPGTSSHFECDTAGPEMLGAWRRWADSVLCHNVSSRLVRHGDIYYTHSRKDLRFAVSVRLRALWCVSRWLADRCNTEVEVVPQPVSPPPEGGERADGVLRICTPRSRKWRADDMEPYYRALRGGIPSARFVFVGCPRSLKTRVREWCAPNATEFHAASVSARRLYSSARVLLYTSSQTESYGRIVCEAQQAGCIPIVSGHSGLAEQIMNGQDGFAVQTPAQAKDALREAFLRFDELTRQAVESGRRRGSLALWARRFLEDDA